MDRQTAIRDVIARTVEYKKKGQEKCTHCDARGDWSIGLQHNFPDLQPRGICLLCSLFIEPRHWVCTISNQFILADAHPLYPVVRLIEQHDEEVAAEEVLYVAAVDASLSNPKAICAVTQVHQDTLRRLYDQFNQRTEPWKTKRNIKIEVK